MISQCIIIYSASSQNVMVHEILARHLGKHCTIPDHCYIVVSS